MLLARHSRLRVLSAWPKRDLDQLGHKWRYQVVASTWKGPEELQVSLENRFARIP